MRKFLTALAATALATTLLQTAASAHYIWATVSNGQARFALLEDANTAPTTAFAKYVAFLAPQSGGKTLTLGGAKDGARYAALTAKQSVVTADSTVGAKERGGQSYLLVYHAKGASTLAAAGTMGKMSPEITAKRVGSALVLTVLHNAAPVADAEVFVQWPGASAENEEAPGIRTDAKGTVKVDWPATLKDGFVGVRAMVTEAKAGENGGTKYDSIHHWTTLTFPVKADTKNRTAFK